MQRTNRDDLVLNGDFDYDRHKVFSISSAQFRTSNRIETESSEKLFHSLFFWLLALDFNN